MQSLDELATALTDSLRVNRNARDDEPLYIEVEAGEVLAPVVNAMLHRAWVQGYHAHAPADCPYPDPREVT